MSVYTRHPRRLYGMLTDCSTLELLLETFKAMEMNLPGYATLSDMDGVPGDSILVTIGGGSPFDSTGNDFVDELTASVSGIILEDTDGDGDGDEPIAGVSVKLIVVDGVVVGTTTTGTDGTFVFDGVPPGTYTVVESTSPGFTDVTDSDGGDPNSITVPVAPGVDTCLLYTSPSPRDGLLSRMPSSA